MNRLVYNIETGEGRVVPGIDAKEYVATGGWSSDSPPAPAPPNSESKVYVSEAAAKTARTKQGLTDSHDIIATTEGYVLQEKVTNPPSTPGVWMTQGDANTYIVDNGLEQTYEPVENPNGPGWILSRKDA